MLLRFLKETKKKDFIFVLCGSDKGNLKKVKSEIKNFELDEYFRIFEFVDDRELISLYLNSSIVLMPTDGGPTNLPMFESFYFKKLLFYSDHLIDKDDEMNNFFMESILESQRISMKNCIILMKIKKKK